MDAQSDRHEADVLFCPSCGQQLGAANIYCPRCGRPVFPPAPPTSGEGDYSATTLGGGPTPPGAWPGAPLAGPDSATWLGGPAQGPSAPASSSLPAYGQPGPALPPYASPLAGGPVPYGYTGATYATPTALAAPPVPTPRKRRVGCIVGSISVVLVVALLLAGALVLYTVFANADVAAAKYVPGNTVFYSSVDLVAMAVNQHGVNPNAVSQSSDQGKQFQQATCLDYQTDIKPWLGRDVAFAVFPRPAPASSAPGSFASTPTGRLGYAVLLQSHDDSATQTAVRKAVACQQQRGNAVSQTVYGGLTIYTLTNGPTGQGMAGALAAGDGWALLASDSAAAQVIVDRLGGKGDTLAASATFLDATRGMPANRFGTLYVNTRQLVGSVLDSTRQSVDIPFVDLYPTAAGYVAWTSPGGRAQLTLKAARPLGLPNLTGDSTGLASLVPGNALVYAGVANLGATLQAERTFTSTNNTAPDLFATLFGVPATDPALQQPAALAVLGGTQTHASSAVFLLRAPDPGAVSRLLQTVAASAHWTLKPTTVAGQPAMAIYAATPGALLGGAAAFAAPDAGAPEVSSTDYLAGVAAQVNGVFVVAGTAEYLGDVIQTAQGGSSLPQSAAFKQLVALAPGGHATTTFVDVAGLQSLSGAVTPAVSGSASGPQTTALLVTSVWNDQMAQITVDAKFSH